MRYLSVPLVVLSLLLTSTLHAEEESVPARKVRTPDEQKKIQNIRERVKEKKEELNGSSWELTLKSTSDPKAKPIQDTFTFQDDKVTSKGYEKKGFASTNYTVSVSPDPATDMAVWETMKTGSDGVVFIRGEWLKDSMQGNVTEQLDEGKKVNEYYFNSDARKAIAKSSKKEETEDSKTAIVSEIEPTPTSLETTGSGVLVSKESVEPTESAPPAVLPFNPGTIDEDRG